MKEKKTRKQNRTIKLKDVDASKAAADPKGGLNFTRSVLPAVQLPTDQITDGTLTKTTK